MAAAEARHSQSRLQLELVRLLRGRSERLKGEGEPVAAARELDRWEWDYRLKGVCIILLNDS